GSTLGQLGNAVVSSGRSARCRGRSTRELYPKITAQLRDGTRLAATLAGHAVAYPPGAIVPERVDRTGHDEQAAPRTPGSPLAPGLEWAPVKAGSHLAGP